MLRTTCIRAPLVGAVAVATRPKRSAHCTIDSSRFPTLGFFNDQTSGWTLYRANSKVIATSSVPYSDSVQAKLSQSFPRKPQDFVAARTGGLAQSATWVLVIVCLLVFVCATGAPAETTAGDPMGGFDHNRTAFPLDGAHVNVECEACHVHGVFAGTPVECGACHNGSLAVGRTAWHVRTLSQCEDCHTTRDFKSFRRFDHADAIGTCMSCHNNVTAPGQPSWHFPTGATDCHYCHNIRAWRLY